VFARAAREPRVIAGALLVLASILVGAVEYHRVRAQADHDYVHCAPTPTPPDCVTKRKPIYVLTSRSSGDGFRKHITLSVLTGDATTISLGVSGDVSSHFSNQSSTDVRYRHGHPAAIVADDGSAVEVPFIFSLHVAVIGGVAVGLFMLGGGLLAWGFTRVNRSPHTA
jgi:hypothetical protein